MVVASAPTLSPLPSTSFHEVVFSTVRGESIVMVGFSAYFPLTLILSCRLEVSLLSALDPQA